MNTKIKLCVTCAEHKPATDFFKASRNKDGLTGQCKSCRGNVISKWQKNNRAKAAAAARARYWRNHEQELTKLRDRRKAQPEPARMRCRKWRGTHRQQAVDAHNAWAKANPEKLKLSQANYKTKYPERRALQYRRQRLKKKYGMTIAQYDALLASQDGGCAICRDPSSRMTVDHCHQTGLVRSILCCTCNTMLGMARDRIDILRTAIKYLETHSAQPSRFLAHLIGGEENGVHVHPQNTQRIRAGRPVSGGRAVLVGDDGGSPNRF